MRLTIRIGLLVLAAVLVASVKVEAESIEELKLRAERGSPVDQFNVGLMYDIGDGVQEDKAEAAKWYRMAAEQGDTDAQYVLGEMYDKGLGMSQDSTEAVKWYRKAAEQGNANAQYQLGEIYSRGQTVRDNPIMGRLTQGVQQNLAEAYKWYRLSSEQGNADARSKLEVIGRLLAAKEAEDKYLAELTRLVPDWRVVVNEHGFLAFLGTPTGLAAGETYHSRALACLKQLDATCVAQIYSLYLAPTNAIHALFTDAEKGDATAQFALGRMYEDGVTVQQDMAKAVEWYRKAAESGNAGAQCQLGLCYALGRGVPSDDREAGRWYRLAADHNHSAAQLLLGLQYYWGKGQAQDYAIAASWIARAANSGLAAAQYVLATQYLSGNGVEANAPKAVDLARKAADQGDAKAQDLLAALYRGGYEVQQDLVQAARWSLKAAEQGIPSSQYLLALLYAEGEGVSKDNTQAASWCLKAATQGYLYAQIMMGDLYAEGTGVNQDRAQAAAWYRKAAEQGSDKAIARLQYIDAVTNGKPIAGTMPKGSARLVIKTEPSGAIFSVFSGYTYLFSGVTPFSTQSLAENSYNICLEKSGYDLFWKNGISVGYSSTVVTTDLRAAGSGGHIRSCLADNSYAKVSKEEENAINALKLWKLQYDAENAREEPRLQRTTRSDGSTQRRVDTFVPTAATTSSTQPSSTSPGAIDVRTGQFYPNVGGGNIINPTNGTIYQNVGGGYINTQTGEFVPKQ